MSIKSTVLAFLSLFIIIVSTASCKRKCPTCDYGTSCINGYCFCPNGREGDSCNTFSFTKYINKSYIVSDPCSGYGNGYSVNISVDQSSPNLNRLFINNLFGSQIEADILSDANKQGVNLNIPAQSQGAFGVQGSGIYQVVNTYSSRITLQLDYTVGGVDQNCTVILTQQ